ncbi:unnamed protein product, partial [Didymodactylos carnosus]
MEFKTIGNLDIPLLVLGVYEQPSVAELPSFTTSHLRPIHRSSTVADSALNIPPLPILSVSPPPNPNVPSQQQQQQSFSATESIIVALGVLVGAAASQLTPMQHSSPNNLTVQRVSTRNSSSCLTSSNQTRGEDRDDNEHQDPIIINRAALCGRFNRQPQQCHPLTRYDDLSACDMLPLIHHRDRHNQTPIQSQQAQLHHHHKFLTHRLNSIYHFSK